MKEKELRLALVCYGGVSLAVYMHGLTKEIWKLQRASKAWRDVKGHDDRWEMTFDDADRSSQSFDTESIYFELLKQISKTVELRVLVDVIAGASAGGINGVFLAQAIADDLSLDPLTDLWLNNADVEKLLDPDGASGRWSKAYLRPLVWMFGRWQAKRVREIVGRGASLEVKAKLSRFVRSRWFAPPFSGTAFTRMLYEGLEAMSKTGSGSASLLPPGYPLDLMVTVTDFQGHAERLRLHSPPEIEEREHRLIISFHDSGLSRDGHRSLGEIPSLAFAARATASFPGAFPPAQIQEVDNLLAEKGHNWIERNTFIDQLFPQWASTGRNPRDAALIDGSVLNNKPFGAAIAALRNRPAHREVDRRIVYIEPNPKALRATDEEKVPGFFGSIIGSLSTIPRQQPIRDELEWLQEMSDRLAQIRRVITSVMPDVDAAVEAALGERMDIGSLSPETLAQWREIAQQAAAAQAGYTYTAYAELKVLRALNDMAGHLHQFTPQRGQDELSLLREAVLDWAEDKGITPVGKIGDPKLMGERLRWVAFLRLYDIGFRVRRLRFVIRRLNHLYSETELISHAELDETKRRLYSALSPLIARQGVDFYNVEDIAQFSRARFDTVAAIETLGRTMALSELDESVDLTLSQALGSGLDPDIVRPLMIAYVGFPFVDVITLPMMAGNDIDDLDPIRVDRLSPSDAVALRTGGAGATLKGIEFATFGAFLSRAYRENDYLWGRLHAAERMIDIVLSSVTPTVSLPETIVSQLKTQAFQAILVAERPRLLHIQALIDELITQTA